MMLYCDFPAPKSDVVKYFKRHQRNLLTKAKTIIISAKHLRVSNTRSNLIYGI